LNNIFDIVKIDPSSCSTVMSMLHACNKERFKNYEAAKIVIISIFNSHGLWVLGL